MEFAVQKFTVGQLTTDGPRILTIDEENQSMRCGDDAIFSLNQVVLLGSRCDTGELPSIYCQLEGSEAGDDDTDEPHFREVEFYFNNETTAKDAFKAITDITVRLDIANQSDDDDEESNLEEEEQQEDDAV